MKDINKEQAKKVLIEEEKKEKEACLKEINKALEKYNFKLSASTILTNNSINHVVDLVR